MAAITHADINNSASRIEAACHIHDTTARFVYAKTIQQYKAAVHATDRCRRCEAALETMGRFEISMREAFQGHDGASNSLDMFLPYEE